MIKKLSPILITGFLFAFVLLGASGCGMFGGNQQAAQEEQAKKDKIEQQKQAEAAKAAEEAKKAQEEKERLEKAEQEKAEQEAAEKAKAEREANNNQVEISQNNTVSPSVSKVLVGPYASHAKAKAAVLKLRKAGFGDAFVKNYDGKYWAQLGSYKSAESANAILEQAQHKKYNGVVIQE